MQENEAAAVIHVERLEPALADDAAKLFTVEYARVRHGFPMLSVDLEGVEHVGERLRGMRERSLAAVDEGRIAGYLAWWEVDRFRGSPRRGAYVPEWGHAAIPGRRAEIYRALYRAASAEWSAAACTVHAISMLANDEEAREVWFWNGFGLAVVDAARQLTPLDPQPRCSLTIRRTTEGDSEVLGELDAEHVRHYAKPPVFMAPPSADTPAAFAEFVQLPKNSVWLALDGEIPAGFMRFTGYDFDAVAVLQSDDAAFCNAAYVRPEYRGGGAGGAMLRAAIDFYAGTGLRGLYTNFESFNPEAASFWPRYFQPVCLSLMRVPEVAE